MARIAGINIPVNKHIVVSLTSIYGVGRTLAITACEGAGIDPTVKVKDLSEPEVEKLRGEIAKLPQVLPDEGRLLRSDLRVRIHNEKHGRIVGCTAPQCRNHKSAKCPELASYGLVPAGHGV